MRNVLLSRFGNMEFMLGMFRTSFSANKHAAKTGLNLAYVYDSLGKCKASDKVMLLNRFIFEGRLIYSIEELCRQERE